MHGDLMRIRQLDRAIRSSELRLQELRACLLPAGIRYDLDRVQTSPYDRMSETVAELADLELKIDGMKAERAHRIIAAGRLIDRLDDDTAKLVVTAYYIAGEPMSRIADEIGYSERHTRRIKSRALEKMSDMSALGLLQC